jgi:hypothetical protein
MISFQSLYLILVVVLVLVQGQFLPIDGGSVAAGSSQVCVLERRMGIDEGGRAMCFQGSEATCPSDVCVPSE